MNLVVGATGSVGAEICRLLRGAGKPVRALYRPSADPQRVRALRELGVELVEGDLKKPTSLIKACQGVRTVISTASSTLSRQEGDSIESVDLRGHLHLIEAIRQSPVENVVFMSFPKQQLDFPLQTAKRAVENELVASGRAYTILQPTFFMEVWLSPALGFDPAHGKARLLGKGDGKINWISMYDVARAATAAVDNPRARNKVFTLGGPDALSQTDVLSLFASLGGPPAETDSVSEEELLRQFSSAPDALGRSFAAMMVTVARGLLVDATAGAEALQLTLRDVRQYAKEALSQVR